MTVKRIVLPSGTLLLVKSTVTGLVVVVGNVTSALPVGFAGTAVPATVAMRIEGAFGMNSGPGVSRVSAVVLVAVRVMSDPPFGYGPWLHHQAAEIEGQTACTPTAESVPFPAIAVATKRITPPDATSAGEADRQVQRPLRRRAVRQHRTTDVQSAACSNQDCAAPTAASRAFELRSPAPPPPPEPPIKGKAKWIRTTHRRLRS